MVEMLKRLSFEKILPGALMALALYFPFEPFILKFVPDAVYVAARYLPEVVIYSLAAYLLFKPSARSKPLPVFFVPFILLIAVALFSMGVNMTPADAGLMGIRQIIRFMLVLFLAYYAVWPEKRMALFLKILLAVVLFQSALGLVQAFVGAQMDQFLIPSERKVFNGIQLTQGVYQFWESGQRVFATMGRYDQLGIFLSFALALLAAWWYRFRALSQQKWILLATLAILPTFLLTYSRAAWFGALLAVIVIGLFIQKDKRIAVGAMAVALLAIGYLGYSISTKTYLIDVPNQTVVHRFFEAFSLERWKGEYTGLGRAYFFHKTFSVVVPYSPLFGVGPGSYGAGAVAAFHYTAVYEKLGLPFGIYGTDGYIDNNWLSIVGELGLIGLGLYIWLIVLAFKAAHTVARASPSVLFGAFGLGTCGIIAAVCFQASLATYLETRTVAYYLWLAVGICASHAATLSYENSRRK